MFTRQLLDKMLAIALCVILCGPHSAVAACRYELPGDANGDCKFDFVDVALTADNWLVNCNLTPDHPACKQASATAALEEAHDEFVAQYQEALSRGYDVVELQPLLLEF